RKPIFEKNISEIRVQNLPIKPISIFEKIRCPERTVPIRRTTKNDLIKRKSLFNAHNLSQNRSLNHFALLYLSIRGSPYYGVSGITSVWNPNIYKGQSSAGHLYFKRGKGDGIDKISVGWHVSLNLFYNFNFCKNGCFNMLCKGFIQVDRSYIFGARVSKTSTYGGEIMEVALQISKDNVGNWWLKVLNKDIGYFPAALFSSLKGADQVGFGGYTVTPAGTDSPTMGSGHKPDGDFTHASYFRFVKHLNIVQEPDDPLPFMVEIDNDAPNCYGVTNYEGKKRHMGYSLQFGGPGGKC
ncbi:hypothetical protein RYX36_005004, partial [Vicia faba]